MATAIHMPSTGETSFAYFASGFGGYTWVDRTAKLTNGKTVAKIGLYGKDSTGLYLKILKRTSANTYDVVVNQAATLSSTIGWQWFDLSPPFAIPETGDYYVGMYSTAIATIIYNGLRSYANADKTGNGQTLTEDNSSAVFMAVQYADGADLDAVLKSAGGNWNDDNLGVGDEANVADGVAFGLSQEGTLAGSATDPDYVISSQGGNWDDSDVTAANLVEGATAGVNGAIVGEAVVETHVASDFPDKANVLTTDSVLGEQGTFDEAARNIAPPLWALMTGAPCKICNVDLVGTLELSAMQGQVNSMYQVMGLDPDRPVTAAGDGIATKTLTVEGMTVTITPDGITRT